MTSRIIPARAGFTGGARVHVRDETDHPRSRGVYSLDAIVDAAFQGSSPLARGLLLVQCCDPQAPRIIPARAGFTRACQRVSNMLRGSSPLARGLRGVDADLEAEVGIIPARAGFTGAGSRRGPSGRDHPRSRGVYESVTLLSEVSRGSSPLARGLLAGQVLDVGGQGIIPARAGFTSWSACRRAGARDHPRSRGVY